MRKIVSMCDLKISLTHRITIGSILNGALNEFSAIRRPENIMENRFSTFLVSLIHISAQTFQCEDEITQVASLERFAQTNLATGEKEKHIHNT